MAQVFIDDMTNPRIPMTADASPGFFAPVDNPDVAVNKVKAGQSVPMKWKMNAEPATTWEDYYRFKGESNDGIEQADWTTRPVDSLIFQARSGAGPPAALGNGFLYRQRQADELGDARRCRPAAPGDASVYGPEPFTAKQVDCDDM